MSLSFGAISLPPEMMGQESQGRRRGQGGTCDSLLRACNPINACAGFLPRAPLIALRPYERGTLTRDLRVSHADRRRAGLRQDRAEDPSNSGACVVFLPERQY